MADDEPSAAGGNFSGTAQRSGGFFGGGRKYSVNASFDMKIPGLDTAAAGIGKVNAELGQLKEGLRDLGSSQYMLSRGVTELLSKIEKQALSTANALGGVNNAVGSLGAGGTGGSTRASAPAYGAATSVEGTGWMQAATGSATNAQNAAGGGTMGGALLGGGGGGGLLGGLTGTLGDAAMFPMRFMRDRIQNNRQSTLYAQQSLSAMAFATGRSSAEGMGAMMGNLATMPGGLMGTQGDVMSMLGIGRQVGATYGFGGQGGTRSAGYMRGLQEMQRMTPGVALGQLAGTLGSQSGNVQAAQTSAFYTSGAFSMIGMGGRQKSVSEWAEGILRWLENQRPGRDRGKGFTYGELLAQHFPGSNIDAWLSTQGVTPEMKEYFWTYAEGKSNKTGTTEGGPFEVAAPRGNLGYERLRSQTEFTKGEFGLGAKMGGQYGNREQVNTWFNKLMAQITNAIIPSVTGPGSPLSVIQMLPDFIEDLMFNVIENMGPLGQIGAGATFTGAAAGGASISQGLGGLIGGPGAILAGGLTGDVGDIGDYGTMGGTSTAGLHPDMRRKVNAMQRANPRIKVTSGLRDHTTQQRLHKRGVGRVSGKPSAHTRGMAADLGPSSEYGWISANAKKFGLSSGRSHGEPWHVGMGDIGDNESGWQVGGFTLPFTDQIAGAGGEAVGGGLQALGAFFTGIMSMISGVKNILTDPNGLMNIDALMNAGKSTQGAGSYISGGIGSFMNLLLGEFTGAGRNPASPTQFTTNLGLTNNITLGGSNTGRGGGFTGGVMAGRASGTPGYQMGTASMGGGGALSASQVAIAAYNAGFRGEALIKAVAIAQGESGFDPTAHNPVGPDNSYGLWQVNMIGGLGPDRRQRYGLSSNDQLFDPVTNARAAFDISGGGGNFRPWSVYTSGAYNQYMDEARAGAQAVGVGDLGTDYARYMPLMSSVGASTAGNVTFHNTFRIDGGGGMSGGSIDMRRTVTQLADHLESEMKSRAARSN